MEKTFFHLFIFSIPSKKTPPCTFTLTRLQGLNVFS
uniref:Uncharacterized protein n=1 Tax=Anguilla anguilla TaxID=7936 RepID=A0A0E9TJQ6_ANGAN